MDVMIKEIVGSFDYKKVHKVMQFLNWEYHDKGVPSIETIIMMSIEAMELAVEKCTIIETGGFRAEYNGHVLDLQFILTDQYANKEE